MCISSVEALGEIIDDIVVDESTQSKKRCRNAWTAEEDAVLLRSVGLILKSEEKIDWIQVSSNLTGRTTKQTRDHYLQHLDPNLSLRPWTPAEDQLLVCLQKIAGNQWKKLQQAFNGRSDHAVC